MQRFQVKYIHLQAQQFHNNFLSLTASLKQEKIHDYRIAVKRIRSIVKFLNDPEIETAFQQSGIKKIFRLGGHVREFQLNEQMANNYEKKIKSGLPLLHEFFNKQEKKARKKLAKKSDKYSPGNLFRLRNKLVLTVGNRTHESIRNGVKEFIINRMTLLQGFETMADPASCLHPMRKLIKDIKYMFEFCEIYRQRILNKFYTMESLTELEDQIGIWHDDFVYRNCLIAFSEKSRRKGNVLPLIYRTHFRIFENNFQKKSRRIFNEVFSAFQPSDKAIHKKPD